MNALRENPLFRFMVIVMSSTVLFTSCMTTRRVDDKSRPRYETKETPVYENVDVVTYRKQTAPVFRGADRREAERPIGLAVLDFYSQSGSRTIYNERVTNTFYSKLLNAPNVWEKFQPYQPSTLKSMFSANQLNAGNRSLMREFSNTNIPFAVSAELSNTQRPDFELSIYRTSNGISIFSHQFRTTGASNAIDDAIRFLMTEELPHYSRERQIVRYDTERIKVGYHKKSEQVVDVESTIYLLLGVGIVIALIAADNGDK